MIFSIFINCLTNKLGKAQPRVGGDLLKFISFALFNADCDLLQIFTLILLCSLVLRLIIHDLTPAIYYITIYILLAIYKLHKYY